ncbi:poly(A) polymerase [Campylobacter sp. CCS1377]|uniref:Poly(A) polymerase n=1 Tax=Campylobacter sp. CCS1377 TaxID=3158229 RepID=A0AAU7E680_9BACT
MDLKSLENRRLYILKRLGILKLLSVIEALLVGFLAFVFTRDAIICLASAVLVGIFFFRLTSRKLLRSKEELQIQVLNLFLRRQGAKFQSQGLSEEEFKKLALIENLKEFKSKNHFIFKDFEIYDIWFKTHSNHFFCGILLEYKNNIKNLPNNDIEVIFTKLKHKNFDTQFYFYHKNFMLIASLCNPFFIDFSLSLESNFKNLEQNFIKIQTLFA